MYRRRYLKMIIVSLVLLLVVGCSDQSYEEYQKAVEKTENVQKGKYSIEVSYQTNFNEEVLSIEDFKEASKFSDIKLSGVSIFDHSNKGLNFFGNLEGGNLGLDLEYYQKNDKKYLKIPILGKYIDVADFNPDDFSEEMIFNSDENIGIKIDEASFEAVGNLWSDAILEENVFKGKKSLLETPDGDVKVTEYAIEFSDELLKRLINETMVILDLSDEIMQMDQISVDAFKYIAFVDIDGYIIQENFSMSYLMEAVAEVKSGEFKFEITNYDLNKEQKIEMPEINEDMLLDLDKMNDLFNQFEELNVGEKNE